jgi:cyclase
MKRTLIGALIALAAMHAAHSGEPVWDANRVEMVSEQLGKGVYACYAKDAREVNAKGGAAATSGGLIVGSKGAPLIETMLNERLNKQVQGLSRKLAHAPLLYAVNTSAHGDHSYGNMFLPAQTKIIQHANTRNYVQQHLADDKAFMIEHFGAGRGIEPIRARTGDVLVAPGGSITLDLACIFHAVA